MATPLDRDPTRGSRSWYARLLLEVRYRSLNLEDFDWTALAHDSSTAVALVRAQQLGGQSDVYLGGQTNGHVWVHAPTAGNLTFAGTITDGLSVQGRVGGGVAIDGSVLGGLWIGGTVARGLSMRGQISEGLSIDGSVGWNLSISGTLGGSVSLDGSVRGNLSITGSVGGGVSIHGAVGRGMWVVGTVHSDLQIPGEVSGDLWVSGAVGRDVVIGGSISGGLWLSGAVARNLVVAGRVGGDLWVSGTTSAMSVSGSVTGVTALDGRFTGRVVLAPETKLILGSVRTGHFEAPVLLGDSVDLSRCDFRQCPDLSRFELIGSDLLAGAKELSRLPAWPRDPQKVIEVASHEMASIYRQLRGNLEERSNRPAAHRFYVGEMNERRRSIEEPRWRSTEWWALSLYRGVSGYGLSVWRPLMCFFVAAAAGTIGFAINGLDLDPDPSRVQSAGLAATATFAVRSMLSFFSPPEAGLSVGDLWLQIALRFAGPVLLAFAAVGLREKVAR